MSLRRVVSLSCGVYNCVTHILFSTHTESSSGPVSPPAAVPKDLPAKKTQPDRAFHTEVADRRDCTSRNAQNAEEGEVAASWRLGRFRLFFAPPTSAALSHSCRGKLAFCPPSSSHLGRFAILPQWRGEVVLQDGYRLVLLPRLALFALWDGTGETFIVPRAKAFISEAALPGGSYVSDHAPLAESAMMLDAPSGDGLMQATEHASSARPKRPPVRLVLLILRKVTHLLSTMYLRAAPLRASLMLLTDGTRPKVIRSMRLLPGLTSSTRTA